jgi:deoxyribodipyrimidine photolyase
MTSCNLGDIKLEEKMKTYQYQVLLDFNGSPFSPTPEPFIPTHTFIINSDIPLTENEAIRKALEEVGTYPRSYGAKVVYVMSKEDLEEKVEVQEKEIAMLRDELKETSLKLKIHQSTDVNEIVKYQQELLEFYQAKRK